MSGFKWNIPHKHSALKILRLLFFLNLIIPFSFLLCYLYLLSLFVLSHFSISAFFMHLFLFRPLSFCFY